MSDKNTRVSSFMRRFNASRYQASFLLDWVSRLSREDAERSIASRIMQDDDLKQIGYDYLDRNPEYLAKETRSAARARILAQLTRDILDEVYDSQDAAPVPVR